LFSQKSDAIIDAALHLLFALSRIVVEEASSIANSEVGRASCLVRD